MIELTIEGRPQAQKRHRYSFKSRCIYDASRTDKIFFKAQAEQILKRGLYGYNIPLKDKSTYYTVVLNFCFLRPKSHYGTGKNKKKLKPSAPVAHTIKPDLDDLVILALDALNGVCWRDDSQITNIVAKKTYTGNPDKGNKTYVKIY